MTIVLASSGFGTRVPYEPPPTLFLPLTQGSFDPLITFTRASAKWFFGSDGNLQTVGNDVWPVEYDQSTLEILGRRVESAKTNLVLWCRDLTNAAWTKTNCTAALDQQGLDGAVNTASSLTATSADATCLQSITSASALRCQSAYLRRISGAGSVFMTLDNGGTWTSIVLSGEWQLMTCPEQSVTNPIVGFKIETSGDVIAIDCVQNESGTNVVNNGQYTSRILTTTTAVTRANELATVGPGANFSWYVQGEGTFMVEAITPANVIPGSRNELICLDDNTFNETIRMFVGATTMTPRTSGADGGATQWDLADLTLGPGQLFRAGMAYASNNVSFCLNGGTVVEDTPPVSTIPTPDRMKIGRNPGNDGYYFGILKSISYWAP